MTYLHGHRRALGGSLALVALLVVLAAGVVGRSPSARAQPGPTVGIPRATGPDTGNVPFGFVGNVGQAGPDVRYLGQAPGFGVFFREDRIVLAFERGGGAETLHLVPLDPSPGVRLQALDRRRARVTYVRSTGIVRTTQYGRVAYRHLWPGIDMVLRAGSGEIKYEFHVAPGADPARIRLAYEGIDGLGTGPDGALVVDTPLGELRDTRPSTFQSVHGRRAAIRSTFVVDPSSRTYGFAIGAIKHPRRPVVIDPSLDYSTYLGGGTNDIGVDVAVDRAGSAYVTGATRSAVDFPTTPGVADPTYNSDPAATDTRDIFVAKIDRSGTRLVYSTFIGGSGAESGQGIAVDSSGSAYVSGGTGSSDFPTTPGAFDETHNNYEDAFVVKLNPDGTSVEYATVIGGGTVEGEFAPGIAVDSDGRAFVTGGTGSPEFPTTDGAYDTTYNGALDVFVSELSADGSELLYSTLLGGNANDVGFRIALHGGEAYVTGDALSASFPTTGDAFDATPGGGGDAFVARVDPASGALVYSTLLGGTGPDFGRGIAVTEAGVAVVSGGSTSADFPTTKSAFDRRYRGEEDGFVSELDAKGSRLVYSTLLGGSRRDRANAVAVGRTGAAFVIGDTASPDFPTTGKAFQRRLKGREDAFVTQIDADGSSLPYSTYLGGSGVDFGRGIAIDRRGVYVTGRTASNNFPTSKNAFDRDANGGLDGFVMRFSGFAEATVVPG